MHSTFGHVLKLRRPCRKLETQKVGVFAPPSTLIPPSLQSKLAGG
jgi:hypothetical protein